MHFVTIAFMAAASVASRLPNFVTIASFWGSPASFMNPELVEKQIRHPAVTTFSSLPFEEALGEALNVLIGIGKVAAHQLASLFGGCTSFLNASSNRFVDPSFLFSSGIGLKVTQ